MDALSDILAHVKFEGSLYFTTEFTAPWGLRVPAFSNVARFHLVLRGRCHARLRGEHEGVLLQAGDFVIIPHGATHDLLDHPLGLAVELDRVLQETGYDGTGPLVYGMKDQGEETRLICGHFAFDPTSRHPVLAELPERIVVRGQSDATRSWLESSLTLLDDEYQEGRLGNEAIISRMTEILFVRAIRDSLERTGLDTGILKALSDRKIARALAAVHRKPDDRWTVESLAREAGLSRTVFAERFHEMANTTPMQYVTAWRLERARALLLESDRSVEDIAEQVGYRSVAAFSRIFARQHGIGPGALRRGGREMMKVSA